MYKYACSKLFSVEPIQNVLFLQRAATWDSFEKSPCALFASVLLTSLDTAFPCNTFILDPVFQAL